MDFLRFATWLAFGLGILANPTTRWLVVDVEGFDAAQQAGSF